MNAAIVAKVAPSINAANKKLRSLSIAQSKFKDEYIQIIRQLVDTATEHTNKNIIESISRLDTGLQSILATQRTFSLETKHLGTKMDSLYSSQSTSTNIVTQIVDRTHRERRMHRLESRNQGSTLNKKIGQFEILLRAIKAHLYILSNTQSNKDPKVSTYEIRRAVQNILASILMLISSLQLLIRELVLLLARYLVVFYRSTVQHFEYSDHFGFEDAVGRFKRLPCSQFQHWDMFYRFLVDSFQGTPGLGLILSKQFMVMNGYNNYPISCEAWRAVIQPNSKMTMAMILDSGSVKQGSCPDPSCEGQVWITVTEPKVICSVCKKHQFFFKTHQRTSNSWEHSPNLNHFQKFDASFHDLSETDRLPDELYFTTSIYSNNDISAFRRVVWPASTSNQQAIMAQYKCGYTLPCEFGFIGCQINFPPQHVEYGIQHSISHFDGISPPSKAICIFCNYEDAIFFSQGTAYETWRQRLMHIASHYENLVPLEHSRPDYFLVDYMRQHGLISEEDYRCVLQYTEIPASKELTLYRIETPEMRLKRLRSTSELHDSQTKRRYHPRIPSGWLLEK